MYFATKKVYRHDRQDEVNLHPVAKRAHQKKYGRNTHQTDGYTLLMLFKD
jgi:hypothetical protein